MDLRQQMSKITMKVLKFHNVWPILPQHVYNISNYAMRFIWNYFLNNTSNNLPGTLYFNSNLSLRKFNERTFHNRGYENKKGLVSIISTLLQINNRKIDNWRFFSTCVWRSEGTVEKCKTYC